MTKSGITIKAVAGFIFTFTLCSMAQAQTRTFVSGTGSVQKVGAIDGTGTTQVGAYDPNTQTWYLSSTGAQFHYGYPGVTPVVGAWPAAPLPQFASAMGPGGGTLRQNGRGDCLAA